MASLGTVACEFIDSEDAPDAMEITDADGMRVVDGVFVAGIIICSSLFTSAALNVANKCLRDLGLCSEPREWVDLVGDSDRDTDSIVGDGGGAGGIDASFETSAAASVTVRKCIGRVGCKKGTCMGDRDNVVSILP